MRETRLDCSPSFPLGQLRDLGCISPHPSLCLLIYSVRIGPPLAVRTGANGASGDASCWVRTNQCQPLLSFSFIKLFSTARGQGRNGAFITTRVCSLVCPSGLGSAWPAPEASPTTPRKPFHFCAGHARLLFGNSKHVRDSSKPASTQYLGCSQSRDS